jgi:hypothetical protein
LLTPAILATWEAKIRSIVVQGQPGRIVHKTHGACFALYILLGMYSAVTTEISMEVPLKIKNITTI